MSVTIFRGLGGATAMVPISPGGIRSILSISGLTDGNGSVVRSLQAIITDHPTEEGANANLMYSADGNIYMNVTGDKVGSIVLSGMSFSEICDFNNGSVSGYERALNWYRANRISLPGNNSPITIQLGSTTLYSYLSAISLRVADPGLRLFAFTLPMFLAPDMSHSLRSIVDANSVNPPEDDNNLGLISEVNMGVDVIGLA